MLLKMVEARYSSVARAIREMHSYELPSIHSFAFEHISPAYADWIESSVG